MGTSAGTEVRIEAARSGAPCPRRLEQVDAAKQGALSSSRGSDEGRHRSFGDLKIVAVEDREIPETFPYAAQELRDTGTDVEREADECRGKGLEYDVDVRKDA